MSTAAIDAPPPAAKGGKKKLIIIIAVAALVLVGGGVGAMVLLKKKPPADVEADAEEGAAGKHATAAKHDPGHPPVFVPLDPFTVNLADRESERYAQVGITLEIDDAKTGEQIKIYMPAIRNQILMAIADRSAVELLGRDGKIQLAERVRRETSRALGIEVDDEEPAPAAADEEGKPAKKGAKKKKKAPPVLPIKAVHFSNFIIQ
jgi:flagellar FliL protein